MPGSRDGGCVTGSGVVGRGSRIEGKVTGGG